MTKHNYKEISGHVFGRLTVVANSGTNTNGDVMWECRCVCGRLSIVRGTRLRNGETKSCGCLAREAFIGRSTRHGQSRTRLYRAWANMLDRCLRSKSEAYRNYGGRGISICDEWARDFTAFRDWAFANGYNDDLTIERINVDGNYEPSNCCWIPKTAQPKNTRRVRPVICEDGRYFHTGADAARAVGRTAAAINSAVRGKHARCAGLMWRFANDVEILERKGRAEK
jgi:hypothetical protein